MAIAIRHLDSNVHNNTPFNKFYTLIFLNQRLYPSLVNFYHYIFCKTIIIYWNIIKIINFSNKIYTIKSLLTKMDEYQNNNNFIDFYFS